jgi:hypothetical protein
MQSEGGAAQVNTGGGAEGPDGAPAGGPLLLRTAPLGSECQGAWDLASVAIRFDVPCLLSHSMLKFSALLSGNSLRSDPPLCECNQVCMRWWGHSRGGHIGSADCM